MLCRGQGYDGADYSFKIKQVRIKEGIPKRQSFHTANETECVIKCIDDEVCSIVAYKASNAEDSANNCLFYSFEKVSCKVSGVRNDGCKTIASDPDMVVWFNPGQKYKDSLEF